MPASLTVSALPAKIKSFFIVYKEKRIESIARHAVDRIHAEKASLYRKEITLYYVEKKCG